MFKSPNPKQNFYELESNILKFWKEKKILEKSIEQRPKDKLYTFYDGPITANGEPHTGHMMTFTVKDIITRYFSMKGFRVSRSLGWDCHGIPVEYELEKKLGFKEKKDIEKFGIAKFIELCRQSVEEYKKNIIELEEAVGRSTNTEEEYSTLDANFIESIWWSIKELYNKGSLYEGFKVVPFSTRAGTTLSNAEVALGGYKKIIDPAITVKFKLAEDASISLLAWTTTPWTIPGNLALGVGKDIDYVLIKVLDTGEKYIVAEKLVEKYFNTGNYEILNKFKGEELEGKNYIPPFKYYEGRNNAHKIYLANFVTTDTGTGIVHLAPYGADDNDIFVEKQIDSFDYLTEQGDFKEEIKEYSGLFYRKANDKIIIDLETLNCLFKQEDYEHELPMCWRTNTPLIYKPVTAWYVSMSKFRARLVELNNTINWVPDHVREGRFGNWLSEIKDWGISRSRYWGTPLPIWKSESGKIIVIGSFDELEKFTGKKVEDPHKPYIDEFTFTFDNEEYKRIPEVLDVWYDSGAMPFARLHYPFENKELFENKFPADFIAESVDQTRGWFYHLHAISTTLFDNVAFKNVIMNGFTLDDNGVKQSKSKKNYSDPLPTVQKFGGDSVRMNFFSTTIVTGEDTTITDRTIKQTTSDFILPVWNIYSYFVTYANLHNFRPTPELASNLRKELDDDHPWDHMPFDDISNEFDAWILLKLQQTIKTINEELSNYKLHKASLALRDLVNQISKWYIRSNRDRFVNGEVTVLKVMYYVLLELSKLMSVFTPFLAEEIYQNLTQTFNLSTIESIHLCDFPEADTSFISQYENIESEMEILRKIVEIGHNIRTEKNIKVRIPLREIKIKILNSDVPSLSPWMKTAIATELNILSVHESFLMSSEAKSDNNSNLQVEINTELDTELLEMGLLREFSRNIQAKRKLLGFLVSAEIGLELFIPDKDLLASVEKNKDELKKQFRAKEINILLENKPELEEMKLGEKIIFFKILSL